MVGSVHGEYTGVGGPFGALLEEVASLHRTREQAGARILVAATVWAARRGAGSIGADRSNVPGGERLVRLGGPGTPKVAEFAAAEFAASVQLSPHAGGRLTADALDLQFRLSTLGRGPNGLRSVSPTPVARKARDLTVEQAGFVDARVAESADGRLP